MEGPELYSLRVGSQVLYRLASGKSKGELRPAFVVRLESGRVDLRVLDAGVRDAGSELERGTYSGFVANVPQGSGPGEWQWPSS
jgi:hypothetical protein